jgi:glycosyltransferase involved in cell wall biosynthesis
LRQNFQDFEIIVVDNKSTDNTVEVLQPYVKENKIRLFCRIKIMKEPGQEIKVLMKQKVNLLHCWIPMILSILIALADAHNYLFKS